MFLVHSLSFTIIEVKKKLTSNYHACEELSRKKKWEPYKDLEILQFKKIYIELSVPKR